MHPSPIKFGAILVLVGILAPIASAVGEGRPAEQILEDIKAVELPKAPERRNDPLLVRMFLRERDRALDKKAALILELYKAHPESPELPTLMVERWEIRSTPPRNFDESRAEIEEVLASSSNEKLRNEAAFIKVAILFKSAGRNARIEELQPIFEDFAKQFPKDQRGGEILYVLARRATDEATFYKFLDRMEREYPESQATKTLLGQRRLRDAIGKPFVAEFTDAIRGTPVSTSNLKGKVLVIDFWATWCGPCVEEMPEMKRLYALYKDRGVEFIGINLDASRGNHGLETLKAFVSEFRIEWPQYFLKEGFDDDLAVNWGISMIPTLFVVDAEGKIVTTQGNGRLETLIPEYLEKAKAAKAANGAAVTRDPGSSSP